MEIATIAEEEPLGRCGKEFAERIDAVHSRFLSLRHGFQPGMVFPLPVWIS
jgi:hypothetical protein